LANLRRAVRAALPDDRRWITPHSFRRTVATVVRDDLYTTEAHYLQRHTHAAGTLPDESIRKVSSGPDSASASKAV
jgi:integrase